MQVSAKQKVFRIAAGSLLAACSVFGAAGAAGAEEGGGGDDRAGGGSDPGVPQPVPPNIPDDPGEGLPIPLPGGGG